MLNFCLNRIIPIYILKRGLNYFYRDFKEYLEVILFKNLDISLYGCIIKVFFIIFYNFFKVKLFSKIVILFGKKTS